MSRQRLKLYVFCNYLLKITNDIRDDIGENCKSINVL